MFRFCVLLFAFSFWGIGVWGQAPFQRGFSLPLPPTSVTYIPNWGVVSTMRDADYCESAIVAVSNEGDRIDSWRTFGSLTIEEVGGYADDLWAFGNHRDSHGFLPIRKIAYAVISRDVAQPVGYTYEIDSLMGQAVYSSHTSMLYGGHALRDSFLVIAADTVLFGFNPLTHTFRSYLKLPSSPHSLFWQGDSLVCATDDGIWKMSAQLENLHKISNVVLPKVHAWGNRFYVRQGMQLHLLDTLSWLPAFTQDFAPLLDTIDHWTAAPEKLSVLGKDALGKQQVFLLNSSTLDILSNWNVPREGGTQSTPVANGVALLGEFPNTGLYVSDAEGNWQAPTQRVELVENTAAASDYRFIVFREHEQDSLWSARITFDVVIRNLGPDTLRSLDRFYYPNYGQNCSPGSSVLTAQDLAVAPQDTFHMQFATTTTLSNQHSGTQTFNILLRNPNQELMPEDAQVDFPAFFEYTARPSVYENALQPKVYPNPVGQEFRIVCAQPQPPMVYTLRNLQGQVLKRGIASGKSVVSVGDLAGGVYVLSLRGQDGAQYSVRLLKQ